jgi:archaellum component FlaC
MNIVKEQVAYINKFLDDTENKYNKLKNDTVKRLKRTVVSKEQDIKIFKQKVKGSEIQLKTSKNEINFLKSKIKRLEKILKVHS